jgi:hypothetical protein
MEEAKNLTPAGAPVLDCGNDHQCTLLTCDMCLVELPAEGAIREEGVDYVAHFCGLDCLESWRREGRVRRAVHDQK